MNEVEFPGVYVPFAQMPSNRFELIVRTAGSVSGAAAVIRATAAQTDPGVPVTSLTTFEQRVQDALQGDRLNLLLISGFGILAIVLSAIGVYGSAAYHVQSRTREFGIRLALGARPAALVRGALLRTGRLAVLGALLGLAATHVIARLLGNALYMVPGSHNGLLAGVTTTDPAMLASAFAGVLIVAALAAGVPSRRVARVDPLGALRCE